MKLAVMQPYFFPYLGYFQLLRAVDRFISYDDVNFIKQGWINRNFILMNCQPLRVTVPLSGASSFRTIAETALAPGQGWRGKFLTTVRQAYSKAPFFDPVFAIAEQVVLGERRSIAELALASVEAVADYLEINVEIRPSALPYNNRHLRGEARILDICRREGADAYYNLAGGQALYDPATFAAAGVKLHFVLPRDAAYRQFACAFVPRLSILDVLMFNDCDKVRNLLADYQLTHDA